MKTKITKISAITASLLLMASPMLVSAQIENPLKFGTDIPRLISTLLGYVVRIGGILAVFLYIYDGYLFAKAQGNDRELQTAKDTFVNISIGVAVLLGAQLIASIIIGTLNSLR